MIDLVRAAPYVKMHRGATFVVKVGGGSLDRDAARRRFAEQLAVVTALGARVVVVHGGGPQTDALQRTLGEEPRMIDGRRVTSETALRALRLATVGGLNGDLVAALEAAGVDALGMTAAGAATVRARRRPPVETADGTVDFGRVGDVESVDPGVLRSLLDRGVVPVVSPPASDGEGGLLNVNADVVAAAISVALDAAKLVLMTGAPGILEGADGDGPPISSLSLDRLRTLDRSGALANGMKVKAAAIETALVGGVPRVHVVSGGDADALLRELYTTHGAGTLVTLEPESAPPASATADRARAAAGTAT